MHVRFPLMISIEDFMTVLVYNILQLLRGSVYSHYCFAKTYTVTVFNLTHSYHTGFIYKTERMITLDTE